MKLILGSGVVGLLARHILGDDWSIIPFYRSRFYSYMPPLCDNFIIADPQIDHVITSLGYPTTNLLLNRAYSSQGHLYKEDKDGALATSWLLKLFNGNYPSQALPYYKSRISVFIYDKVRVNKLYAQLMQEYTEHLKSQAQLGKVTSIGNHEITFDNNSRIEFEYAVSTIPLKVLYGLLPQILGKPCKLSCEPLHYIHMETKALNFEGASQVFVVDPVFSFYKVSCIAKNRYMFYCHQDIKNPGQYFMPIIPGDYDLIDGTTVSDALITGEIPDFGFLDELDIYPVGSFAQSDFCADIGSNILKLVKYAGRDFQAKRAAPNGFKELVTSGRL